MVRDGRVEARLYKVRALQDERAGREVPGPKAVARVQHASPGPREAERLPWGSLGRGNSNFSDDHMVPCWHREAVSLGRGRGMVTALRMKLQQGKKSDKQSQL